MSKEITKANIIQEIQEKLGLREFETSPFLFSETVIPVYEITGHLKRGYSTYTDLSITGTGGVVFFTIPEKQRWHLRRYNVVFLGAGAFTVAGLYINRVHKIGSNATVYIDLTAGQTVSYSHDLPKEVVLDPGDKISINVDGYTSTQSLRLIIDIVREDLR